VPWSDCLVLWLPPGLLKLFQARLGKALDTEKQTWTRGATDALMLNLPNNRFVCNFAIEMTPRAVAVGRDPAEIQIPARHHDVADLQGRWPGPSSSSWSPWNPVTIPFPFPVALPLSESAPPSRSLVYWRDFLFAFEMFAFFLLFFISGFVFVRGCWLHVMYAT